MESIFIGTMVLACMVEGNCKRCNGSLRSPAFSRMNFCPYCGTEIGIIEKTRSKTEMDYFHQGLSLFQISDFKRASQNFRKGVDKTPLSILLRFSLAISYLEDDKIESFLDEIAVCFEIDPYWLNNRTYSRIPDNPFNLTGHVLCERCLWIVVSWVKEGRFFIRNTKQYLKNVDIVRLMNEGKTGKTRGRTKEEKAQFWTHESYRLIKAARMFSPGSYQRWISENEKKLLSGGSCFIATAAFGSNMTTEVLILRCWRDKFLLSNNIGMKFVQIYYTISPPIANTIRKSNLLQKVVANALRPASKAAENQIKNK